MLSYWFELISFWILSCLDIIRIPVEHCKLTLFELQYELAHSKLMRLYLCKRSSWIMWVLWASDHSGAPLWTHLSCNSMGVFCSGLQPSVAADPMELLQVVLPQWRLQRFQCDGVWSGCQLTKSLCVFKDGSLSSCRNKLTSSCFRLKVLMSSVSRSNSMLGAVSVISLFKGVMAASSAWPEYVLSSNVEESACRDVYLHLIFQNLKHVPQKVITWL